MLNFMHPKRCCSAKPTENQATPIAASCIFDLFVKSVPMFLARASCSGGQIAGFSIEALASGQRVDLPGSRGSDHNETNRRVDGVAAIGRLKLVFSRSPLCKKRDRKEGES
jgi:hypothetical protein